METATEELKTPYLNDREAATYLGLSSKFGYITVQRWARLGVLKAGKVGDHWRFRKEDLDDFVFAKK